jgi:hypothetical protein
MAVILPEQCDSPETTSKTKKQAAIRRDSSECDYLLFAPDCFCAALNLMPMKCFGTPFSAGFFSRNAFAEASCFR